MSVKFLIDSASDMTPEEAAALGVFCLPIQISFDQQTYEDAVTLTHEEFYKKLASSDDLPVTSQINPLIYEEKYKELIADSSSLVVIALSSKLSGTYQNAVMAAQEYPDRVFVVDSLNATSGQYVLLLRGLELAAQGLSAQQIAQKLDEEKSKLRVVAVIDTLEYLKKGGRISSAVALAGGLLGIKPAIAVKDGSIEMAGTARGSKKAQQLLQELIEREGGINWNMPVSMIYSGTDTALKDFMAVTQTLWRGHENVPLRSLGGAIGTHIGPGAFGVAFFQK